MELSDQQLRAMTFGWVHCENDKDCLRFCKNTPAQIEAWARHSDVLAQRAGATSGILLDLETDAAFAAFTVRNGRFEVLLDGLPVSQQIVPADQAQAVRVELPEGTHRVTLVYPSHAHGQVLNVELPDGAAVRPHRYDRKFLFLGDSITQGWNAELDCMSYAHQVSEYFNAERVINGVGGGCFAAETFEKTAYEPDTVIIAFGTNDFRLCQSLEQLRGNARAYLEKVQRAYSDRRIFVILPIWRSNELTYITPVGTFRQAREAIREECDALGLPWIDGYTLVPHLGLFYYDEVHPNDLGFSCFAKQLIRILEQ